MNDSILWQQLKQGDKSALEAIYSHTIQSLFQYGKRFSTNEQLIEDAIQDLFVEIWNKRSRLGQTDNIKGYLLLSLRRKIIRQIEQKRKTQSELTPEEVNFDAEIAIDEQLIQLEINASQSEELKKAFEELSPRQKEAIYLKYYEELDYEDICEAMSINYQSVRNLVFTGLKKLKQYLAVLFVLFLFFLLKQ